MKKYYVFIVILLLCVFKLASCNALSKSRISIDLEGHFYELIAHNNYSKKANIPHGARNPYMFFSFDDAFILFLEEKNEISRALCLDLSFPKQNSNKKTISKNAIQESSLAFGFLTEDDFKKNGDLKNGMLPSRALIDASFNFEELEEFENGLSLSFAFPPSEVNGKKIKGFFLYSKHAVEIEKVYVQRPSLGWSFAKTKAFFAFSSMGGTIPGSLEKAQSEGLSLATSASLGLDKKESFLSIKFFPQESRIQANSYPSLVFDMESERYTIQRSPRQNQAHIYISQMKSPRANVVCLSNKELLTEMLFKSNEGLSKKNKVEKSLKPLTTDPGSIIVWDKNTWRQDEYELFSWELFPSVLIMDFKNYQVQDDYLKRLAFFAEKSGFTGRLSFDEEIKDLHGFNAHDYSAETLADFFTLADKENFPLNKSELHLRSILLENGVLKFDKGKLVEGEGALLSISQESYLALRYTLMGHEAFHGIYFTQKDFRDYVLEVYNASDALSRDFLMGYFTTSETLNYDLENDYLLKNEFMAYLLQQSIANTGQYFVNLALRYSVSKDLPELSNYVKNTKGAGLTEACRELDAFIYKNYGLSAGRVRLVYKSEK